MAKNDSDYNTTINTFVLNGFNMLNAINSSGEIIEYNGEKLTKLVQLMIRPDGTIVDIVIDPISENYYMSPNYTMYKYNKETKKIYDKDNVLIASNVELVAADAVEQLETVQITKDGETYEYKIVERFDNKEALIAIIPDKEIVDIATDLAGYNCY